MNTVFRQAIGEVFSVAVKKGATNKVYIAIYAPLRQQLTAVIATAPKPTKFSETAGELSSISINNQGG
jgi:hypothetical protein